MKEERQLAPKDFIKRWMDHRKVFISEADKIPDEMIFLFNGKSELGIPFTVLQPRNWETSVIVLSETRIGEEHINFLKSMRLRDRKEFLSNLIEDISFAPATYAFDPEFDKTGIPIAIQFSKEICYDGLTEDRLSKCMNDVVKCSSFVILRFRKEFEEFKGE